MNKNHLKKNIKLPPDEPLPSDDELKAMEDTDGTDIVDPVEFKKMQKEIDELAGKIVEDVIVEKKKPLKLK
ncbi:MAG: hypothetical protein OXE98_06020 [Hyphomicrobiales bacterium]|nr:hypothetical protein [Hyphomicrobiales bacterium]